MDCPFCNHSDVVIHNNLAIAVCDRYPVSPGHVLIIPRRHIADYFDISKDEREAVFDLVDRCRDYLDAKYNPDGYNIGINCGEAAGQTIFHVHIHLIPRYRGDIDNPRGGVRGVITGKRIY